MDVPSAPIPAPSPLPARDDSGANVKETLESILVAFILAFIFRCFVVEAFVIPTGSMAPTLLGAHSRFVCTDCGYRFDVNYSAPQPSDDDVEIPDHVQSVEDGTNHIVPVLYDDIYCPNCGLRLPTEANPPVWYGDRILVLKYLYLLQEPQRWDVVVFKSPSEKAKDYATNFIKRLVGKPGETIMVLDGDIYVKPKGGDHFAIARKTAAAQDSMWRIVYDNDYHPEGNPVRQKNWRQPWQQTTGGTMWSTDASLGRVFKFDADDATAAPGTISFNGDANRPENKNAAFYDWISYDQRHSTKTYPAYRSHTPWLGEYPVSDLKLDLYYTRAKGDGPLRVRLTKLDHAFTAEITPHSVRLLHDANGLQFSLPKAAALPFQSNQPIHIEFTNVDYQVTLRIDGKDILQTTADEYHPDLADLEQRMIDHNRYGSYPSRAGDFVDSSRHHPPLPPPTVSISAERQACEVSHVSLWRDVYYTPKLANNQQQLWAGFDRNPGGTGGPVVLGDNEFFVMGDNSPMSYDARFWWEPVDLRDENLHADAGRVPDRFMLGKAFFVYWPAGFRPAKGTPALIPNIGQMRFIR